MGNTFRIPPSQLGRMERALGANAGNVMRRAAVSAAFRSIALLQQRTRDAPPANPAGVGSGGAFNTGTYLRSWKSTRVSNGATVYNSQLYAGVIELGRRPGKFPPIEAIARWAQRRLGMSENDARAAAFNIARAIAARGLLGRHVMTGALKQLSDIFLEEATHEMDVELGRVSRGGGP